MADRRDIRGVTADALQGGPTESLKLDPRDINTIVDSWGEYAAPGTLNPNKSGSYFALINFITEIYGEQTQPSVLENGNIQLGRLKVLILNAQEIINKSTTNRNAVRLQIGASQEGLPLHSSDNRLAKLTKLVRIFDEALNT